MKWKGCIAMAKSKSEKNKLQEAMNKKVVKMTKMPDLQNFVILETSKQKDKFIKRVERICRSSMEYKDYIRFLKDNVGLDSCLFFKYVSNEKGDGKRVRIEMHHEPLTLYDYVSIVLAKYEKEGIPYNDLLIADEVMNIHAENGVGIVPLSVTAHQVVHSSADNDNKKLFVPINMVYGDYKSFMEKYDEYIDDAIYEKIERKVEQTKELTPESFDALTKQFTYYEVEGYDEIQPLESVEEETPVEIDEEQANKTLQQIMAA